MPQGTPGLESWIAQEQILRADWKPEPQGFEWRTVQRIAGLDVACRPKDQMHACVAMVVVEFPSMQPVASWHKEVRLSLPYIPGLFGFREGEAYASVVKECLEGAEGAPPDVLIVDGNGLLHPREFGLACHVGVLTGLPTIGVSKMPTKIHSGMVRIDKDDLNDAGARVLIKGESGRDLGYAMRTTKDSTAPIFVSPGHLLSLESCWALTQMSCRYRVPEPIRFADRLAREKVALLRDPDIEIDPFASDTTTSSGSADSLWD